MKYYPIGIPTLCRYKHLKRCVESLKKNTHAEKTELVISLDYPLTIKHKEGYNDISTYVDTITGFGKVTIIRHDKNLGATKNWEFVLDYILKNNESAIMTEDDNEFAPCFLDYINKALNLYKENEKVLWICGYTPFDYKTTNTTYVAKAMSAWGCAITRHQYERIKPFNTIDNLKSCIGNIGISLRLFRFRPKSLNAMINQITSNQLYGDSCYLSYCILNDTYCLFPTITLVRNWGNDGSGEHCKASNYKFISRFLTDNKTYEIENIDISEKTEVRCALKKDYGDNFIINIAYLFRFFIYRFAKYDIFKIFGK